ncbi:flagellar biosynthetic protein FliO [Cellulomonas sp. ATA003]|uniref:flagellar biosynthetic protein FliO n=1 Tax=Cellulomonas sp. ATA003 TaxID=3073064 RepID=UPI0028739D1D|nr:flagellar biosynthetic protein FliO [Cellulomonas sp. ATA003]WNB85230.1 flagellar biosynthetic protein FliO [Cellulomonas sp. ATA003]
MDAALLGLRVLLALACVLGLIWFTGRRLQGTATVRKQRSVPLSVLGRQSLGKGAGIALVEVAGRVLLLGVGDQGVRVLTEVDLPAEPVPAQRTAEVREEIDLSTLPDDVVEVAPVATDDVAVIAADDVAPGTAAVPAAPAALEPVDAADGVPTPHAEGTARLAALAGLAATSSSAQAGALQGSVLSPDTWRRAVDVVQRRTARR